ncbi:MAG TPA: SHOCT domain-containing protein [Planctomycetes bacterium]|nr:SHOCT domain-containing protein [Planctomycetota bacterium]
MSSFGKVIGGAYLDSTVTTATFGSDLVVQAGFKGRKLTAEHVKSWEEIPIETKDTAFSAMGKAAAGVALPGRFGKAASAAVGAAFDSKKPPHHVRVDWVDGKQSLLKLPDALFTHLALVLADLRIASAEPAPAIEVAPAEAPPTVTDKAFDLVSELVKDRFSSGAKTTADAPVTPAPQVDVTEQLRKLASLRDAGILSEEEFTVKKTELLERL